MSQVLKDFTDAVHACLKRASAEFNIDLSPANVTIENNIRGNVAGQAWDKRRGKYRLRFNLEAIEKHNEEMTKDTIPHEVAHLVCYARPELGNGHDAGWKRVCRRLGGDDSRTHDMLLTPVRVKEIHRFEYNVCGHPILCGPRQHRAIQDGTKQYFAQHPTKGRIQVLHWMWNESSLQLNRTAKVWETSESTGESKKQIATRIWYANLNSTRAQVIALFVSEAGMTKAGASTYYQNFKSGKYF